MLLTTAEKRKRNEGRGKGSKGKSENGACNLYENRRSIETGIRYEPFCFGIGINTLGYSLGKEIAVGVCLCLVQRIAGTFGENSIQGYLD